MAEHIEKFQKLNIRENNIPEKQRIDVSIGTLKDKIQHEVHLWKPDSLERAFRLTLQQLEERKEKGLCYNCDNKYIKGHKCAQKKLFYIDYEEENEKDQETSEEEDIHQEPTLKKEEMNLTISCKALARNTTPQTLNIEGHIKKKNVQEVKDHIEKEEMNLTISCNALDVITTLQTIKIEGHIKKKKVIVLIDSGSTHNFIHCKIAKGLNCFLYPAPECQMMVASVGTINCSGKCCNINLYMGEYVLNNLMISIPMVGDYVVLGVQWLQYLGTIAFNFQERFMKFSSEGKEVELRGITGKPRKIINSNRLTKLLKKEKRGLIAQLCSLEVPTSKSSISPDVQKALENHSKVFETPKGLPPIHDHYHSIHLIPGSVPPNIKPYRYPYAQKSEIECMVAEMLDDGIIQPNQSSFSTPVVLMHKKDGSWRMCPDYRELNKLTIKDKFPSLLIDELLDELHGLIYFTRENFKNHPKFICITNG
eukprot:PITA_36042